MKIVKKVKKIQNQTNLDILNFQERKKVALKKVKIVKVQIIILI